MANNDKADLRHQLNQLKGFAYFENFEDISKWNANGVDPLQRSNTPLLARTLIPEERKSNVMLIHDYAGGYKEYEASQGAACFDELYSCEYLQCVELFVYFTHKLVSVPPPTWVNSCHRNGVKVLGTLIVEPGSKMVDSILRENNGRYWLADRLAEMSRCFGFDGWLINIETSFPLLSWSCDRLVGFLKQLRSALGDSGRVVWYDGLTVLNIVWYQNALNAMNLRFAQAAGSILTNYAWNPELARSSQSTAQLNGFPLDNVYIGIDVWAQNKQHGRNKRVTYPVKGGGGTGTGLGMKELASLGLGTGIFAPAWSYEHFPKHGREVERAIWTGQNLPSQPGCDCGDDDIHTAVPYQTNPVTKYAKRYAAGSESFFHTSYDRAFSRQDSSGIFKSHLGQLSVLPNNTFANFSASKVSSDNQTHQKTEDFLVAKLHDCPSRCTLSTSFDPAEHRTGIDELSARLVLHQFLLFPRTRLELVVTYRKLRTPDAVINIFVQGNQCFSTRLPDDAMDRSTIRMGLPFKGEQQAVSFGIGVKIRPQVDVWGGGHIDLVEIFDVTIAPFESSRGDPAITDARVVQRGHGDLAHRRLVWTISDTREASCAGDNDFPWSNITGPFSHFTIAMEGEILGRAYGLEYILDEARIAKSQRLSDRTDFVITGYGFDGKVLGNKTVVVSESAQLALDDEWVIV